MPARYHEALREGATLITANARLARKLRREYDLDRQRQGDLVWEAPDVLPWGAWLGRCWQECVYAGATDVVLSPAQERVVWEQVIRHSPEGEGLLHIPATAASAAEAWALANEWEVPLDDACFAGHLDGEAFLAWARAFQARCRQGGWLTQACLGPALIEATAVRGIRPPARLLLAGFDELAPQQKLHLRVLEERGGRIERVEAANAAPPRPPVRTCRKDTADELTSAAVWARARLEQNPAARIGVVIPELASIRDTVERVFDDVLRPGIDVRGDTGSVACHISAGPLLTDNPLISAALLILGLGLRSMSLADAGRLLRSPFTGGAAEECGRRALLDADLRRRGFAELDLATLLQRASALRPDGSSRPYHCPELAARLGRVWRMLRDLNGRQRPSTWSRFFSRLLASMHWPGERTLSSDEYQAARRWNELLSEFAELDLVLPELDCAAAVKRLRSLAAEARFAPKNEGAPVQIMGALEASGSNFDSLWIMGLHDRAWPRPARPNPFLPVQLQRAHDLPRSSPTRELSYARNVMERLLASSLEIVCSYPQYDGDEPLRPSPLILALEEIVEPAGAPVSAAAAIRSSFPGFERIDDAAGPPVEPGTPQRGGTALIAKQAACPFGAFAEFRLGARKLEEPVVGLSPSERGKVLHAALALVWQELKTHAELAARPVENLRALIARSAAAALLDGLRSRGAASMPRMQALEQQRLERLLAEWLALEREREPFEVLASEAARTIELAGLAIEVKIDREDRLADGTHAIIDYKTGDATPSEWEGERPDAPQVPLYSATHADRIAAVLFAQVKPGELRFKGLAEREGAVPDVKAYRDTRIGKAAQDNLADHIAGWRQTLESIAGEFMGGVARVSPKDPNEACRYCGLECFCRISDTETAAVMEVHA